tara:strand:+ start:206068 stop:206355 length:288 start_codon:yes stop_codon:yes gene_type:complete
MSEFGERCLCQVYCSSRRAEMYLYVDKTVGLAEVPQTLLAQFGEPREVMTLLLEPSRKMARANAVDILDGIATQGFYLQMPPTQAELLRRDGQNE